MKIKKYAVLLLSVLMTVSVLLAGCGDGPGEPAGGGKKANNKDNEGKTVLNFWTPQWGDKDTEWFEKWIDEYNKSQDEVVVELEVIPGDAWDQKVVAAQAAGTSPD